MIYKYTGKTPTIYRDKRVLPGETVVIVHESDLQKLDPEQWQTIGARSPTRSPTQIQPLG